MKHFRWRNSKSFGEGRSWCQASAPWDWRASEPSTQGGPPSPSWRATLPVPCTLLHPERLRVEPAKKQKYGLGSCRHSRLLCQKAAEICELGEEGLVGSVVQSLPGEVLESEGVACGRPGLHRTPTRREENTPNSAHAFPPRRGAFLKVETGVGTGSWGPCPQIPAGQGLSQRSGKALLSGPGLQSESNTALARSAGGGLGSGFNREKHLVLSPCCGRSGRVASQTVASGAEGQAGCSSLVLDVSFGPWPPLGKVGCADLAGFCVGCADCFCFPFGPILKILVSVP